MSLASALGLEETKKIRYAIVGVGDISQEAMMPGIDHTGNSEIAALVSGDPTKLRELGEKYGVEHCCLYEQFPQLLTSGAIDAIYLATPNWRHAEFAVPALEAGIHVLCEKPLEISKEKCEQIIAAAQRGGARLMCAYRLHFEPATLDAIQRIRKGELGELVGFSSVFGQMVDPGNHRAHSGVVAGPVYDMAPYPINAIRYLFGAEPVEVVSARGVRHADSGFDQDFDDTVAVTLRLPGNQLAQFTVSYFMNSVGHYTVAGTKGSILMNPGFTFDAGLEQWRRVGEDKSHEGFKHTDQFGGQMKYFSDCILKGDIVEPDGEEGLCDVVVVEAILKALETGGSVPIPAITRTRRIDPEAQVQTLRAVSAPEPINAASPARKD